MNIEFLQIAAAAVIIMLMAVTLRDIKREYAVVISVVGSVLLLVWGIFQLEPIMQKISMLSEMSMIEGEYSEILLKALGISLCTRLAEDICCDAGESAIASKLDFCGKISLLLISLPLFEKLIDIAERILFG